MNRKNHKGYVYFITCGAWVKIGYSLNGIDKRLQSMRTGNPYPLKLYGYIDNVSIDVEQWLHRRLKKYNYRGEWFSLGVLAILEAWNPTIIVKS